MMYRDTQSNRRWHHGLVVSLRQNLVKAVALGACLSLHALAAIRPSFYLSACSWNATDIVVLAPTPQAGTFKVLETIEGELTPGALLALPGLTPPQGGATRLSELTADRQAHPFEDIPPVGQSDRLIVFLRRPGALPEWSPRPDLPVETTGWESANFMGDDLRISAVWIQDGVTYAFRQTMNPGPSQLAMLLMSETELRKSIQSVIQLRKTMDRAVANPDPVERGRQFAMLIRSQDRIARMSAIEKLEHGGAPETKLLFDLISDQNLLGQHSIFIDALVRKRIVDQRFAGFLNEETVYWSQVCHALKPGWWIAAHGADAERTKAHYTRAYSLLNAIHELNLTKAMPVVQDFARAWKTCPPIENSGKVDQISEELKLLTGN